MTEAGDDDRMEHLQKRRIAVGFEYGLREE